MMKMKASISAIALAVAAVTSEVQGNRVVRASVGSPFRFSPPVVPNEIPKEEDTVWWPATGRPPMLKKKNLGHIQEDRDTLIHTDLSYPNPFQEPERCVAIEKISHSWLCDPDGLLSKEEQAQLEMHLLKLRDTKGHKCLATGKDQYYQAAVAVATDIVVPENETPQEASDGFAKALLKRWGVGNKGCHDGILLLYVKNLRTISIATRAGIETKYLGDDARRYIQRHVHTVYLVTGSVGEALISGVDQIADQLPAVHEGIGWVGQIILSLVGVYVLSVALVYIILHYLLVRKYGVNE